MVLPLVWAVPFTSSKSIVVVFYPLLLNVGVGTVVVTIVFISNVGDLEEMVHCRFWPSWDAINDYWRLMSELITSGRPRIDNTRRIDVFTIAGHYCLVVVVSRSGRTPIATRKFTPHRIKSSCSKLSLLR